MKSSDEMVADFFDLRNCHVFEIFQGSFRRIVRFIPVKGPRFARRWQVDQTRNSSGAYRSYGTENLEELGSYG